MALTNRERLIMFLAILAVVILIGDRYVLGPILEKRSQTRQLKQTLQADVEQAHATLQRRKVLQRRWDQMQKAGLSYDIQKTEGLLFRCLEEASGRSRFLLTSIQPERSADQEQIGQLELMVSGTGTMDAVTQFLWDIEMAEIPVRIETLQLGSDNENASQMSLQLKLSSIYLIETKKQEQS